MNRLTIQQALSRLDRTAANQGYPDIDHYCTALSMHPVGWNIEFDKRCTSYWLECWLCTDTMVGTAIVFVDNEPVALYVQTARRNTPHIRFIGEAGADKMRQLLIDVMPKGNYEVCDLQSQIPDFADTRGTMPQYKSSLL